jgi:hypothetical protein
MYPGGARSIADLGLPSRGRWELRLVLCWDRGSIPNIKEFAIPMVLRKNSSVCWFDAMFERRVPLAAALALGGTARPCGAGLLSRRRGLEIQHFPFHK